MTDFNLKMEQLRAEYRAVVAADLRMLLQQAAALHGNAADRNTLVAMGESLHRIAGGAGVFGFTQLSEKARGLELDVSDWLATSLAGAYGAALPELREGLARLAADAAL